jgi:hypothetical protein
MNSEETQAGVKSLVTCPGPFRNDMTLARTATVFDLWISDPQHPDDRGKIWCCAQRLTERNGAISCTRCHTVIERCSSGWRILRVKGTPLDRTNRSPDGPPSASC